MKSTIITLVTALLFSANASATVKCFEKASAVAKAVQEGAVVYILPTSVDAGQFPNDEVYTFKSTVWSKDLNYLLKISFVDNKCVVLNLDANEL